MQMRSSYILCNCFFAFYTTLNINLILLNINSKFDINNSQQQFIITCLINVFNLPATERKYCRYYENMETRTDCKYRILLVNYDGNTRVL